MNALLAIDCFQPNAFLKDEQSRFPSTHTTSSMQTHAFYIGNPLLARWFFIASAIHSNWSNILSVCNLYKASKSLLTGTPFSSKDLLAVGAANMADTETHPISPVMDRSCTPALTPPKGPKEYVAMALGLNDHLSGPLKWSKKFDNAGDFALGVSRLWKRHNGRKL